MFDLKGKFSVPFATIEQIVTDKIPHKYYNLTKERARVMNSWFKAEDDTANAILSGDGSKSDIIKRSQIESDDEYEEKLRRMRLFPLEKKFFESQQRIYDENNVQRQYPDGTKKFWRAKEAHYDDAGDEIDTFYKDKALFVKEELGWGAAISDLMTDDEGNTIKDADNNVIPYSYVIRPQELFNYQIKQGVLTLLVTRQKKIDLLGKEYTEWRAFTPDQIWKWEERDGQTALQAGFPIANPFGEVPATLLKGTLDQDSSFRIGKPRRYSLRGLYMAASELFYDLQKGSLLFGHPIPVYYESIIKGMAGVSDTGKETSEFDPSVVKEKVGYAVVIPDDIDPPRNFFYQADTAGLDHLRKVIFGDLMTVIFFLASIREKNQEVANVSGRAKQFDNLDEQSMLAQTAIDMEAIERDQFRLGAKAREENFDDFTINYSKHHDLSTADEIFTNMTDAAQYGVKNLSLWSYWIPEYLRKRSAPSEKQEQAKDEINRIGMPPEQWQMEAIGEVMSDIEKAVKIRPELLGDSRSELLSSIESLRDQFSTNGVDNSTDNN